MAKIQAAQNRLYKNVFVCKKCKNRVRAEPKKIIEGKVRCRKCGGKDFRQIKKK